mmetsp:Transcript_18797/g.52503  ORF Transcript_18797/g.52503 Transcript_18797/m.52503 type:complete len:258 (-) Transcript_18797:198-971(-)
MTNIAGSSDRRLQSKYESNAKVKKGNAKLSGTRKVRNDDKSNSSDRRKQIYVNRLRRITNRLLKEQAKASVLDDGSAASESESSSSSPSKITEETNRQLHTTSGDMRLQTLEPWVEPPPPDVQQKNDSMTEHTTLCSAFEMLSFDNLCNGNKNPSLKDGLNVEDMKVVGSVVPREISFQSQDIQNGHSLLREELVIKGQRSNFLKKLLQLRSGRGDRSTRVTKVKVYVDPPKPLVSTNSIGNSTLTWPTDFQKGFPV